MKRYFYPLLIVAGAVLTLKAYRLSSARRSRRSSKQIDQGCFETPVAEIKKEIAEPSDRLRDPGKFRTHVESVVRANLADASDDQEFQDCIDPAPPTQSGA